MIGSFQLIQVTRINGLSPLIATKLGRMIGYALISSWWYKWCHHHYFMWETCHNVSLLILKSLPLGQRINVCGFISGSLSPITTKFQKMVNICADHIFWISKWSWVLYPPKQNFLLIIAIWLYVKFWMEYYNKAWLCGRPASIFLILFV